MVWKRYTCHNYTTKKMPILRDDSVKKIWRLYMFGIDWTLDGKVDIIDDLITLDLLIEDENDENDDENEE